MTLRYEIVAVEYDEATAVIGFDPMVEMGENNSSFIGEATMVEMGENNSSFIGEATMVQWIREKAMHLASRFGGSELVKWSDFPSVTNTLELHIKPGWYVVRMRRVMSYGSLFQYDHDELVELVELEDEDCPEAAGISTAMKDAAEWADSRCRTGTTKYYVTSIRRKNDVSSERNKGN